ncbi:hypothetical protein [Galbibacter pacificus]|uniref:Anti-sigma factor n=1 Tax=Galbibacter pacificus TaxID=2996052 RepID=A0ABT6FUW9_9FLAO|nr:hypothetical protein [Galbibacter pacificus]MDG3583628.1 hypothetical protein [Galbibacter pacificus]MDG3586896.1 hypothetical protein [Galbibacter pacificus]
MAQDIKKMFEDHKDKGQYTLPKGHEEDFLKLLEATFPKKRKPKSYLWKIAASIVVLLGIGTSIFFYQKESNTPIDGQVVGVDQKTDKEADKITLGDISPDLKKVEDYYVANINLELADIDLNDANKKLLDGYMGRLSELNDAYKELTVELNNVGPNDQTINALINNLQLRLQLLYRLKEKIKELKESKNEKFTTQNV